MINVNFIQQDGKRETLNQITGGTIRKMSRSERRAYMVCFCGALFFQGFGLSFVSPLVTRLTQNISVTLSIFSGLIIFKSLMYSLGSFLLGKFQRKISPNTLISIGLTAMPLIALVYPRTHNTAVLLITFLIWGIACALIEGGADIQNGNLPKEFAGRLNYLQYAAMSLGAMAGPFLLRFFMERSGNILHLPFYAMIPAFLIAIRVYFLKEPDAVSDHTGSISDKGSLTRIVILSAVLMFFACGIDTSLNNWSPTAVYRLGIADEADAALMPTFFAVGSLLSRLIGAALSQKLRSETVFSFSVSAVLAAPAGLFFFRNYMGMLGLQFLFGFGNGAIFSSLLLILQKSGNAGGNAVGLIMGLKNIGDMFFSWGAGVILDRKGGTAFFAVLAFGALMSFAFHGIIRALIRRESTDQ